MCWFCNHLKNLGNIPKTLLSGYFREELQQTMLGTALSQEGWTASSSVTGGDDGGGSAGSLIPASSLAFSPAQLIFCPSVMKSSLSFCYKISHSHRSSPDFMCFRVSKLVQIYFLRLVFILHLHQPVLLQSHIPNYPQQMARFKEAAALS